MLNKMKTEISKDHHQFISMVSQSAVLKDRHYNGCLSVRKKTVYAKQQVSCKATSTNLRKGYAVRLDGNERKPAERRTWYLPLHGVRHLTKNRLCIVFDYGTSFPGTVLL